MAGATALDYCDADIHSVTVPGAADGWANAVAKWGNLSLAEVLEPAAVLAEEGFPVSQFSSKGWGSRYHCRMALAQFTQISMRNRCYSRA